MALTDGSSYQSASYEHQAGKPPGAEYQRSTETLSDYIDRMASLALPPDIDPDESDATYLARLATLYRTVAPLSFISASYAVVAQSEIDPEATASLALLAKTASYVAVANISGTPNLALTASYVSSASISGRVPTATSSSHALTADTASYVSSASISGRVPTATSASHAVTADSAGGTMENALTASRVVGTLAAGTGVDIRSSTSGIAVYAEAMLSEAVLGTQKGVLTADVNRGAIAAYRDVTDLGGFDTKVAVFTATDNDLTGSAPLISAFTATTEVFRVDKTGSLWSSGSQGFSGSVMVGGGGASVTMSFVGGLFISAS